jgi:acetyl esterase/lipase
MRWPPWWAAAYRPKSLAATKLTALTPVLPGSGIVDRTNGGNMASEQMQQLAALFASGRERFSNNNLGLEDVRDICEGLHAAGAEPEGVTYAEVDAGGVPALWCIPAGCDANSVLLHSHAGGSVVFSMHTDRKAAGHLAKAAGVRVLVLDFRRSPENKYPAQHEDVETAYSWLLTGGYRPDRIAIGGHSIGGNLAVGVAIRLRDRGAPLPAAILTVSPFFDFELSNPTVDGNAETDKLLSRSLLEFFRDCWLGDTGVAYDDPGVNPLYADLAGLPPVSVYYGEHELLAGEAIEFVDRAKGAALDVNVHAIPDGQHSFILGAGRVPEADQAIQEMGRWLRSELGLAAARDA